RSFVLPNKQRVLLTDTVGFLRKLPHTLIESFKATLEEVSEADLLIHIVDLSHPRVDEQMEAVDGVIKELDAYGKQTLIVFNRLIICRIANWRSLTPSVFREVSRYPRAPEKELTSLSRLSKRRLVRGACVRVFVFHRMSLP